MLNKRRSAKAGNYTLCRRRISLNRPEEERAEELLEKEEREEEKKESSSDGKRTNEKKSRSPIVSHRLNVGSFFLFFLLKKYFIPPV